MLNPLVSVGTIIILARLCFSVFSSVTTIAIAKDEPSAEVVNHLRPLICHCPFFNSAVLSSRVGLEPAVCGSVMAKQLRISPFTKGSNHCSFCLTVPNKCNNSAFPASGAWHPKI